MKTKVDIMTGDQCKAARALGRLTQQQLAETADVAIATLAAFEQGNRKPYRRTILALQAALEAHGLEITEDGVRKVSGS